MILSGSVAIQMVGDPSRTADRPRNCPGRLRSAASAIAAASSGTTATTHGGLPSGWRRWNGFTLDDMQAEGWYRDPYNVHTDRWFSDGSPTSLVRDFGQESHDPPPDEPLTGPLVESDSVGTPDADDLRRADSYEGPFDPDAESNVAWDTFGETTGGD